MQKVLENDSTVFFFSFPFGDVRQEFGGGENEMKREGVKVGEKFVFCFSSFSDNV